MKCEASKVHRIFYILNIVYINMCIFYEFITTKVLISVLELKTIQKLLHYQKKEAHIIYKEKACTITREKKQ